MRLLSSSRSINLSDMNVDNQKHTNKSIIEELKQIIGEHSNEEIEKGGLKQPIIDNLPMHTIS